MSTPSAVDAVLTNATRDLTLATDSFAVGFPAFATHVGVTFIILIVAGFLYAFLTPHKEMRLIRAGNPAAGISFGGALIGLSIPLAVCMATSLTWADLLVWGIFIAFVQLFSFRFVELFLGNLPRRIEDGETAAATLVAAVKFAVSVVLAAGVAGAPLARI